MKIIVVQSFKNSYIFSKKIFFIFQEETCKAHQKFLILSWRKVLSYLRMTADQAVKWKKSLVLSDDCWLGHKVNNLYSRMTTD